MVEITSRREAELIEMTLHLEVTNAVTDVEGTHHHLLGIPVLTQTLRLSLFKILLKRKKLNVNSRSHDPTLVSRLGTLLLLSECI